MKKLPLTSVFTEILARPNVGSRQPIFEQYDKNVQGNTVWERGQTVCSVLTPFRDFLELSDATSKTGVAVGTGGNPYYAKIDAERAAEYAIAQGALMTAAVGGSWLGATDCLNFGNPEKTEFMGELVAGIEGIKTACTTLKIPIVSGNVSLYNESGDRSVPPSALVSVFARVEKVERVKPIALPKGAGHLYYLGLPRFLAGSELLNYLKEFDTNIPELDYTSFSKLITTLKNLLGDSNLSSLNLVKSGGAWASLIEMAATNHSGLDLVLPSTDPAQLWGEGLGLLLATSRPLSETEFLSSLGQFNTGGGVVVKMGGKELFSGEITELLAVWNSELRGIF